MKISAIVLTWNGVAYIEECLASLLAQDCADLEVLVVDNGSADGTPELVAGRFPDVKLIRNERNLGFAAGNNCGLRAASGDLLLLLNQDVKVQPGFLACLARTCEEPAVGIAGGKLLYPDGTIQHAGGYLYGPRGETGHVGRHAPDDGRFDQVADADFVTAAALAIRRTALAQIGPLDEGFAPAYYEDVDWCYRARAAGWRVVYQPGAVAMHHESTATAPESHERKFALNQGRVRFLLKHRSLEQLLNEFGPAELAWVAGLDRSEEMMSARRAYLGNLLALPGILAFRGGSEQEADALVALLADLRAASVAGLASLPLPEQVPAGQERDGDVILQALQQLQTLREHTFTSDVPVLGHLIVAVRDLWNNVATKWYVRPLIQQQSAFNEQIVAYLHALRRQLEYQDRLVEHRDRLFRGQSRDVAENIRELTFLAGRIAELEIASSERLHTTDDAKS
jgi:GT2 family glycosyltransferase